MPTTIISSLRRCHFSWRWRHWPPVKNYGINIKSCRGFISRPMIGGSVSVTMPSPLPYAAKAQSSVFERRCVSSLVGFDVRYCSTPILQHIIMFQSRGFTSNDIRFRSRDPNMRNCKTIEELLQTAYDHVDCMSPRGISAFWTLVSKFLQRQNRGSDRRGHGKSGQMGQQMFHQFDILISQTLEDIHTFGYRDMAQTTISLAKIVESVESEQGRLPRGSPKQILQDSLIGDGSEQKKFIFNHIACASIPVLQEFDPRCLSNFIYAFAKAGCSSKFEDGSSIFDLVAQEAIPNLEKFNNSQQFSNMLWAYATAKESNSVLFEKAGNEIVAFDSLDEFEPQALSNLVWAYATTKEPHPDLFRKVANHIAGFDNLESFKPQALANIVWAYATAKEPHPDLFKIVADEAVKRNLRSFKPQGLTNLVWACATAKEPHPDLFKKVADHIVGLVSLESFNPQNLSNLVWAYATANVSNQKLFGNIAEHIIGLDNLGSFKPQSLSNIAWAFATAKDFQPQLFQKLADAAIKRINELESQAISNLLWACATNGHIDKHLFSSFILTTKALIGQCNCQHLANIAWAYAVADVDAPSLFNDQFIHSCLEKRDEFGVESLRQLHQWCLWQDELKSNIRLPPSLEEKCYKAFVSSAATPSGLQNDVISTLLSLGLNLEEEVLTQRGYSLDAVVDVNGKKIGIEVDGPSHFLGRKPTGSTILKHRQIGNLEKISLVSVPYWKWDKLGKDNNEKQQYLLISLGMDEKVLS